MYTMAEMAAINVNAPGTLDCNFSMFDCSQCDTFVSFYITGNKTLNAFYSLINDSDILYYIPDNNKKDIMLKIYNSIDRLWNYNTGEHVPQCIHSVATLVNEHPLPGKGTISNLNIAVIRYSIKLQLEPD